MSEPFTTAQELELKSADAVIATLRAELAAMKSLAYDRLLQVEAVEAERDAAHEVIKDCREFLRWFTPREDHIGDEARDLVIAIDKLVETKND